jgi:hypothetical protein
MDTFSGSFVRTEEHEILKNFQFLAFSLGLTKLRLKCAQQFVLWAIDYVIK